MLPFFTQQNAFINTLKFSSGPCFSISPAAWDTLPTVTQDCVLWTLIVSSKKTLPPRRLKKRKQENHTVFSSGFFMSYQRRRTPLEMEEVNTLLAANQRIPFYQSLTAQRMTTHYLATFGSILDWSSIGQVRPLFSKEAFTYKTSYTLNFFF